MPDLIPSGPVVVTGDLVHLGSIASADANADGKADLLTAQVEWVSEGVFQGLLSVYHGFGDGAFGFPQVIAQRPFHDFHVRDMNGDGLPDFVIVGGGFLSPGLEVILQQPARPFHRGDPNDDGSLDITDPISILEYLFTGGSAPGCLESADASDDGAIDITDAIALLTYLFVGGAAPPDPGPPPRACGPDGAGSTASLGCKIYEHCQN